MSPRKPIENVASGNSLADAIELVMRKAPSMRKAGITEFSCDGVSFKLGAEQAETPPSEPPRREPVDPFHDPASYPGGRVPGYGAPTDED